MKLRVGTNASTIEGDDRAHRRRVGAGRRLAGGVLGALLIAAVAMLAGCQANPVTVSGLVHIAGGDPAPGGVAVTAFDDTVEAPVASTVTGIDGRFEFRLSSLPEGTYRLRVGGNWWAGANSWADATPVEASSGAAPFIEATTETATGSLHATVHGDGDISSVLVAFFRSPSGTLAALGESSSLGQVDVDLLPGEYRAIAIDPNGEWRWSIHGTTTLDLTQAQTFEIVAGATGAPLSFDLVGADCDRQAIAAALPSERDFTGAHLMGCDLSDLSLSGAILSNADLSGADLSGTDLTGAIAIDTRFDDAQMQGTDFTQADLTRALMYRATVDEDTIFNWTELTGAIMHEMDLSVVPHSGFWRVSSGGLGGLLSGLPPGYKVANGYLVGPGADLADAYLGDAELPGADLTLATLEGANLLGSDLSRATFYGADLDGAVLANADLTGTDLSYTSIDGARMYGSVLAGVSSGGVSGTPVELPAPWQLIGGYLVGPGADLSNANLAGLNLSTTVLSGVRSGGITGTPVALPTGFTLTSGFLVGPGADLTGSDLHGADLSDLDLTEVLLSPETRLSGTDLTDADLTGQDLAGVNLSFANLSGTDLSNVGLEGADLMYASIVGADLTGVTFDEFTVLTGATIAEVDVTGLHLASLGILQLNGAMSWGITGTPASMAYSWQLRGGYLVGNGAKLVGANLAHYDLHDCTLRSADLRTAHLAFTIMTRCNLTYSDLDGADLTDATLDNVIFYQAHLPGADLTDATLFNANLTWADLTDANLSGASLRYADLSFTDLRGADISGADLTGANLYDVMDGDVEGIPAALPEGWTFHDGTFYPPPPSGSA